MIRIGIVGCGRILNAHLQGYKKLREAGVDNFRITALVARREDDARMFVRRGEGPSPRPPVIASDTGDPLGAPHTYLSDFQDDVKVKTYTDYRAMIDDGVVDALNDFTTLDLHHQIAEASFKAGKHLMTQKPLAISVAAAQQMIRQAQEAGVTLGTFENIRNGLFTRAAGWAVKRGLIGAPQIALTGSIGGFWSPDKIVADTPWRHLKLLGGGGGSIDIGVHIFHMLRYIFGEVAAVSATARTFEKQRYRRDADGNILAEVTANVDDTFFATSNFTNGAIGQLFWSWAAQGEPLRIGDAPAFYGSEGCIKGGELIDTKGNRVSLLEHFEQSMSMDERHQWFPYGLTDTFALQQLDWLRAVAARTESETSGVEGLHDLAASFAMLESSTLRRQVRIDEIMSGAVDAYQGEINAHYGLSVSPYWVTQYPQKGHSHI